MPSKKKGKKGNSGDDDDLKQEGNIKRQAVLLADAIFGSKVTKKENYQSFGLRPWSSEASTNNQILCPLNNLPLIDYVLEFLASNGIEQVIIITANKTNSLEEYLQNSKDKSCKKYHRQLEFLFLRDTALTNAGDALRELYKRQWIRESKNAFPFLLVSGDVVADLDLKDAMEAHQKRCSHDSAAVMTVVLKPVLPNHKITEDEATSPSIVPRAADLVVGLVKASTKTVATADAQGGGQDDPANIQDQNDYRVLYYDNGASSTSDGTKLPCSFLTTSQSTSHGPSNPGGLLVRHDLLDTGIAICSPDVLGRLEDEFDYLDLAHDFVTNSVAEEEDGLQTRIYAHILQDSHKKSGATLSYAARATDFSTYHAISRDLLQRWVYPTVPDRNNNHEIKYKLVNSNPNQNQNSHRAGSKKRFSTSINSGSRRRLFQYLENASSSTTSLDQLGKVEKSMNSADHRTSSYNNQYQYKEVLNPTKVGRTSVVVGPGIMGSQGSIGEDCWIARCVLGDLVTIGNGVRLVDCHLMDGVVVEDGATLDSCVVAKNAIVRSGASLGKGCYIGEGCIVGANVSVAAFTRVTLAKDDEDDDWGDDDDSEFSSSSDEEDDSSDDDETLQAGAAAKTAATSSSNGDCDRTLVGSDGKGKLWKPSLDDIDSDDEEDDANPLGTLMQLQSIGGDPTEYYKREERRIRARDDELFADDGFSDVDDDEDMSDSENFMAFNDGNVTFGEDPSTSASYEPMVIGRQKGVDVVKEMTEICMEFNDEAHPIENLAIELNSLKFAQNATYGDCATASVLSLLQKMNISPAMTDSQLLTLLKAKLDKFWTGMLQKLCRGIEEEVAIVKALEHAATIDQQPSNQKNSEKSDPEAADAFQKSCEISQKLRSGMAFRLVLQTMHDEEVLSEDAILQWASERRAEAANGDDPKQALFKMPSVQALLEWLEEEDDSDDDDEDSDSDDDDSD